MKTEDENMEWEKDAPLLAGLSKENVFKVPEGYFDSLSQQIINEVKLSELLPEKDGFAVPSNYFEETKSNIQAAIYLETLKPQLFSENKGFEIPENYFETAQLKIKNKIEVKKARTLQLSFLRYAAAACILLTTSLGIYFNIQHTNNVDYQLSKVSEEDIEIYLKQHTDANEIPMLIESLDDDAIIDFDLSTEH